MTLSAPPDAPADAPPDATPAPPGRAALGVLVATVTLDAVGIGLIFPVMPDLLARVSGGTLSEAALWGGLLSAAYAVMQFLAGPVLGALSDRFGRRPVLLVSLGVMGLNHLAMAFAPSVWALLAMRVVAGMAAATHATATAYIADITPPAERGRRFGLIGAGFGMGFVLGPVIGGLLATIDLMVPFLAAGALALANLAFGLFFLPETVTKATARPFRLARANPFGAFAAVAARPGLGRVLACFLILGIAMNVYPAIWAFYGQARFGWSPAMVGISLALYGLCFALGQAGLVGPLIRRLGEGRAVTFGMGVDIATLAALGVVTSGAMALAITPITALGGVVTPALQAIASRAAPADAQGEVQGVLASLNALAMIASPLLMTATFSAFTAPGAPVFAPGAPFLLAAVLMTGCLALHLAPRAKG